jgi:predicted nucleotidyltransferase
MTSKASSGPSRRPSPARRNEVEQLLRRVREWAEGRDDLAAVALVGSWARDEAREDSDVDLVVLTDAEAGDWVDELAPEADVVRHGTWGVVTERRLRMPSGLEVEVGIAARSWAATDPVDAGTRRVAEMGLRALYDPDDLLEELACALR